MTIGIIHKEFHKVTTLERPLEIIGGPGSALRTDLMPLGRPGGSSGLLEGSLGQLQMLDDSVMMVTPAKY